MLECDFVAAIRVDPEDDTLRLVAADWYLENGDPDRATFIRLQCEQAHLTAQATRRAEIGTICTSLLEAHGKRWLDPQSEITKRDPRIEIIATAREEDLFLVRSEDRYFYQGAPFLHAYFRRGFIEEIQTDPSSFLVSADLFSRIPFRRLWLRPEGLERLARVLTCPHLEEIPLLDLSGHGLRSAGAEVLFGSEGLARLRGLDLSGNELTAADMARLAASRSPSPLQVLELGEAKSGGHWDTHTLSNSLGDEGLALLASSPHLERLLRLNLSANQIGSQGIAALAASRHLGSLRELVLDWNAIGPEGLLALAASHGLPALNALSLEANALGDGEIPPHLFDGSGLRGLRRLNLSSTRLGERVIRALAAGTPMTQLRHLNLTGCEIGPEGMQALVQSSQLTAVTHLDLSYNPLGDEGVIALASAATLNNLCSLVLSDCQINDPGALALAQSQTFGPLQRLDLGLNAGPDQPASRLASLSVREVRNAITGPVLKELRQRWGDAVRWETFPDFDVPLDDATV
jgi:uncharacterized protein (TIGR02996 family)